MSTNSKSQPLRLLSHGSGRRFVVAVMIGNLIGCGPVYRKPQKIDLYRVEPSKHEPCDEPIVPPKGLPLPCVPPVTAGPEQMAGPVGDPTAAPQERPIALDEAIQIALSNSGVVRVLNGGDVSAVAATPYDPHIADARLRAALAAFDPVLTSSIYSNWINLPPDAFFGPGLSEPTKRDEAGLTAALSKPWLTGGETRIGYNPPLGYLYLPNPSSGSLNPLYTSNLEFIARQPLLRGGGIAVNKAPIRITQLRRDQTALETQQAVMASVRSVTEAYWELFAARNATQVLTEVVPLLQRVTQIEHERMEAQRSVRADVAKAHSELHGVRQQLVELRAAVVQRELRLRNLLGLPPYDGYVLVPASEPLQAPVVLDPTASIAMAQTNRPDLLRQQLAVRTRENELLVAKNFGLPQLDATALYRWNGVGNALDDSISQMLGTKYQDWQTSMTLTVPLGRRAGAAGIRAATLQLARERAMMQQALHATTHQINSLIQEAAYTHELYREADARWKANTVWLEGSKIRYENPPPAGDGQDWLLAATNDYLSALRSQASAARDAQSYLSRYNGLLARINEARGTILFDSNLDLVSDERSAAIGPAGSSSLPPMPSLPAATPPMNLPTAPLMPLDELQPALPRNSAPLGAAEPLPPSLPPPSSPTNSLFTPEMLPPLPSGIVEPPPEKSAVPPTSALYPKNNGGFSVLTNGSAPKSERSPSLISSAAVEQSTVAAASQPAAVRTVGVHRSNLSDTSSLIAPHTNSGVAPATSISTIAKVRPIEGTSSSAGVRFPNATEEVPAMTDRRSDPVAFPPAPVRR